MLALWVAAIGKAFGRQIVGKGDVAAGSVAPFFDGFSGKAWPAGRHIFINAPA